MGDFGGFSNPPRTGKRDNFARFVEVIPELLRILRDHTPTLFSNSREEEEMIRSLRRRREADGNVQPAIQERNAT